MQMWSSKNGKVNLSAKDIGSVAPAGFASEKEATALKNEPAFASEQKTETEGKGGIFMRGFLFGTGMALTGLNPNLFPVIMGAACGLANVWRVRNSTEQTLKEWDTAQKVGVFCGISTYALSECYIGWFGVGFMVGGTASLAISYAKRKMRSKD